jgi:N-acetylglutamate synthase-like GNAT family acetyltransferase
VLVAADGDRVVGAVAVRSDGRLTGPVVEEGRRGRLVGGRLVLAACIEARRAGLARVAAPAEDGDAEAFLTRLGFRTDPGGDRALVRGLQ